ncbi:hypothetical protein OMCYN_00825 [cyanobiont of Ornithocercus magnificus]|nr:hypothetical protein OMCYN_00825 [cyanobiont of Ornithocercus magnificus]
MVSFSPRQVRFGLHLRVWIVPLVIGGCFALGYGVTQRVLIIHISTQEPQGKYFAPGSFPGQKLKDLRHRYSDNHLALQADIVASEKKLAQKQRAKKKIQ